MKKRNFIILFIVVALSYVVFIGGKDKSEHVKLPVKRFIAGENIYFDIQQIIASQKAYKLDSIFTRLNKRGVFNGTVVYGEKGMEVFKGAYGYSDFRKKEPLAYSSSFQLASVSKMITAMAIMILKKEGRLNYNDTLTNFIPEFPYYGITIRQLLNHRSGLSRYMSLADKYWDVNKPIDNEQVIGLYVKHKPKPYFKADNGFHYCNTNYALLASVVERITGGPFDLFVEDNIFSPLEMENSFVYNLRGDSVVGYEVPVGVPGYRSGGRYARKMGDYYLNGVMGDKGVYSSIEDLYKFNAALDSEIMLSFHDLEEAFSPGSPAYKKRKDNYGFGWRIKSNADSTVYHFGWWKGFRSFFIRDMKEDKVLIVLSNKHKGVSSDRFWDIIEKKESIDEILNIYSQLN